MGSYTVKLKTHSREDLTASFPDLNPCIVHGTKPTIMKIVAGRARDIHYVAICKHDDCSKITFDGADEVVRIWNKWNQPKAYNS